MAETLLEQEKFLKKYNVEPDEFEKTGLKWCDLEAIYQDHLQNIPNLQPIANYIAESLRQVAEVHSIRIRIKDAEHLVEKIIRKKLTKELDITLDNYREFVTDLIGVRALHLFKEDWNNIHEYVEKTWDLKEKPTANIRKGDPEEYTKQFTEKGCKIHNHPFGYRSVHYLIKSQPSKEVFTAELQVRTIFEEGWSEIDHKIRYPYDLDNVILAQVSAIHNRLSGSADEIGSFIKILKKELQERDNSYTAALKEQENLYKELNNKIAALEISEVNKKDLEQRLKSLSGNALSIVLPDMNILARAVANIKFPEIDPSFLEVLRNVQIQREKNQIKQVIKEIAPQVKEKEESKSKIIEPQEKVEAKQEIAEPQEKVVPKPQKSSKKRENSEE